MKNAKHTPGPWTVRADTVDGEGSEVIRYEILGKALKTSDRPLAIASTHNVWNGTAEANARLIAACPELLAQLQSLISAWDYAKTGAAKFVLDDESIDIIRETVAKATGEHL